MLRYLVIICLFINQFLTAEIRNTDEQDSLNVSEKDFIILPFGYYTNETSVAIGLFSQLKFKEKNRIFGNFIYTLKNQIMLFMITDYHLGNIIFYNKLVTENYFAESYGTGSLSNLKDKFDYRYIKLESYLETGKNIFRNSSVFIATDNFYYRPYSDDKLAISYDDSRDQFANGIGLSVKYSDITDKFFRDGILYKAGYLFYPDFFGNLKEFSILEAETAFFVTFRESALNTHFTTRYSFGTPHPEKLSTLGGSEILRGYPSKRFADKSIWAAQIQYDIRFYKDLSLCCFASAGDVFSRFSDITIKYTKVGYGGGILYEFKGLAVRMEAATSREKEIQIIVTGNRAF